MWIRKANVLLGIGAVAVAAIAGATAFAIGPNDSPNPNRDHKVSRKDGDMYIFYGGRSYRSGRLTSPLNRSFRGGGLHGGK